MKGQFVILREATTDTGKTFNWYDHISIGYGTDIMSELSTTHGNKGGRTYTIKAERLFPFETMKKAIAFADRGNEVADHNGTGFTAFLDEVIL